MASEEIFAELNGDNIPVDILVNDAGLGQRVKFWETPLDRDTVTLRVNIETKLARALIAGQIADDSAVHFSVRNGDLVMNETGAPKAETARKR